MSKSERIECTLIGLIIGVVITGVICTFLSMQKEKSLCQKRGGTYVKEICFARGVINE